MNKEEKYKELQQQVVEWGKERGLIFKGNAGKQYLKFLEEVGETARAILKKDESGMIDGFGDIAVTMIILSEQLGNNCELTVTSTVLEIDLFDVVRRVSPSFVNPSAMNFLHDAAASYDLDLVDCLEVAYNEIKDRQGKTENGTFIKFLSEKYETRKSNI
jgi:NTP pyrophosphatase (non-canonical NTP hydrolase)